MATYTPRTLQLISVVFLATLIAACGVNPVTGERELRLISEQEEIKLGEENYQPTLQSQGGYYYLDPALNEYVNDVGQALAAESDRPDLPYEFKVLNSNVPNAWALPGGKIAINRGLLLELENEAQMAAVLGHEIVHSAARHGAQRMQRGMLVNIGMAGLGVGVLLSDNQYAPLILGGAALGAHLTMARYSRSQELEADLYGTRYMHAAGYDPSEAITLQEIFLRMSEGRRTDFLSGLFQSHPPSEERVQENQKTARRLGPEGRIGEEKYQQMIAGIREAKPAYDTFDDARRARRDKDLDKAMTLVEQALEKVPNEAAFLSFRGDLLKEKGEKKRAMDDYNAAVNLYPDMFSYTLSRGLLHRELENWAEAEADFKNSIDSVPTSLAYLGLGDAVAAQGRRDEARQHYQTAAQADNWAGQEARKRLEEMG